jgi:uncharacterized membrane protein YdfJ with MMPL/SSD domain
MQYAVWIALAVVFIAIAPSLFKRGKGRSAEGTKPGPDDSAGDAGGDGSGD